MSVVAGPSVITSGLVFSLDAGNPRSYPGSGTSWFNASGSSYTGTLTNGPTYTSGVNGYFTFDGVNDYVAISGSTTLSEATFSIWLTRNGNQASYAGMLFSRGTSTTGLNYYSNTNKLGYTWNDSGSTYNFDSGLTISNGAWCMCVVTVTATTAILYLCQSSGITTATNTLAHASTTLDSIKLAWDNVDASRIMNGNIAQASIYNRALTAAEITQNFNARSGRYGL